MKDWLKEYWPETLLVVLLFLLTVMLAVDVHLHTEPKTEWELPTKDWTCVAENRQLVIQPVMIGKTLMPVDTYTTSCTTYVRNDTLTKKERS